MECHTQDIRRRIVGDTDASVSKLLLVQHYLQWLSHSHWPTRMELHLRNSADQPCCWASVPPNGRNTDCSGVVTLHFLSILIFHLQTIEGATATAHRTIPPCGWDAPGRLGGTRSMRRATIQEHIQEAGRGLAGDRCREHWPRRGQIAAAAHVYIFVYILIYLYVCI